MKMGFDPLNGETQALMQHYATIKARGEDTSRDHDGWDERDPTQIHPFGGDCF